MYTSVLYVWLKRLNIQVHQPMIYTYQGTIIGSKELPGKSQTEYNPEHPKQLFFYFTDNLSVYAENQILVKNFTTFNMKTYRKNGTAYTDLFKKKMKKLFLESREILALERLNLHLQYLYNSIGFKLNLKDLAPFQCALLGEALIVQDLEYEEYIKRFLTEVEKMKEDKDFEMEPGYPRYIFTSALMLILDRGYILPQAMYMSLGRLAIVIHRIKCQHDEKTGSKTKKETKKDKKKGKK